MSKSGHSLVPKPKNRSPPDRPADVAKPLDGARLGQQQIAIHQLRKAKLRVLLYQALDAANGRIETLAMNMVERFHEKRLVLGVRRGQRRLIGLRHTGCDCGDRRDRDGAQRPCQTASKPWKASEPPAH